MTEEEISSVLETFEDADPSLIKEIIYFDGWCTYEESWGYLIFKGIDDSIQLIEYGYSVMSDDNRNLFTLQEINMKQAKKLMKDMDKLINGGC